MSLFNWIRQSYYEFEEEIRKEYNPTPQEKWKQILHNITNYSVEKDAIERFKFDKYTRDEMLDIIAGDLEEIFGDNWRDTYRVYNPESHDNSFSGAQELITVWDIAFHIWLARKGYIPSYWESREYKTSTCDSDMLGGHRRYPVIVSTGKIIQRHMRMNHPSYQDHLTIYSCPNDNKLKWKYDIVGLSLPYYGTVSPYPIDKL